MLGDGFGGLFLKAGNYMNTVGESFDGKRRPKSFGLNRFLPKRQIKRPLPKLGGGYRGMGFVPIGGGSFNIQRVLSNIPYTDIIVIGGTVFTVYRSTKLLIKCYRSLYRYVEKKDSPKLNSSHVVRFIAEYLIKASSMDMGRVYKIYSVALQL